ncbi:MAG: hypothetical protein EBZ67_11425, partial [Chitinophagia bacterium]|nr:hypothetical protein [Chitinophagia bacterium]
MKKICLTLIGIYLLFLTALAQSKQPQTGAYRNRNLKTEEVNLITGYYQQDGNHSAVTGGIGTQQLMDASNIVQLRFVKWDRNDRKRILETELGVDYHTAASAAWVSKTGASNPGGTRIYPSVTWKREDEARGTSLGWGLTYSGEYNYHSYGANLSYSKTSADGNSEFTGKVQLYADRVKLIQPSEFNPEATLVWVAINRYAPCDEAALASALKLEVSLIADATQRLLDSGRVQRGPDGLLRCDACVIPVGATIGWEAAVFDHYQAVVSAVCRKLRAGQVRSRF